MAKVVNHAPTPAVESPTDPEVVQDDCEALKAKYNLNVASYSEHEEPKSRENNSHHILQDATVGDYVSKAEGLCVLLPNAHSGTGHQVTTARQNERRDNKRHSRGGTQPANNLGQLKDLSKGDLEESFKKMNIPDADAKALAECLVAEAEKQVKKAAKRDKKKELDDSSPVQQTGGCFPARTLVWLDERTRRPIAAVAAPARIESRGRTLSVVRSDWCVSDLVVLRLGRSVVSLAPFHRVLTARGRYRRADELKAGMAVQTHTGPLPLASVVHEAAPQRVYSVGMGEQFECRVGREGLWVELPHTGVAVSGRIRLRQLRAPVRTAAGALKKEVVE